MKKRRPAMIVASLAAAILVASLLFALDTQASEFLRGTAQPPSGVEITFPDLIVARIDVLTMTATTLEYRFVIQNIGDAVADIDGANPSDPSDNVDFQGVLSKDGYFGGADDIGAGGSYLLLPAELAPGEEYTYTMSTGMAGVNYFDYLVLFVEVDVINNLVESNEGNNQSGLILPDGPDLVVESVYILSIDSEQVTYQFTVRNIGDSMADMDGLDHTSILDNVNFRGVLSPDNIIDNYGDKGAGGSYLVTPTELYPGEAFTHTFAAGMGGANYQDFHYLIVEIDGIDNLTETDEENNIGLTEIFHLRYMPLILR